MDTKIEETSKLGALIEIGSGMGHYVDPNQIQKIVIFWDAIVLHCDVLGILTHELCCGPNTQPSLNNIIEVILENRSPSTIELEHYVSIIVAPWASSNTGLWKIHPNPYYDYILQWDVLTIEDWERFRANNIALTAPLDVSNCRNFVDSHWLKQPVQ